jgi:hypothetical protein
VATVSNEIFRNLRHYCVLEIFGASHGNQRRFRSVALSLQGVGQRMPIPIEITVADELLDIWASWSIEEIRQLIEEFEAELRHRPAPPRGALRSRRANAARRPRRRT